MGTKGKGVRASRFQLLTVGPSVRFAGEVRAQIAKSIGITHFTWYQCAAVAALNNKSRYSLTSTCILSTAIAPVHRIRSYWRAMALVTTFAFTTGVIPTIVALQPISKAWNLGGG